MNILEEMNERKDFSGIKSLPDETEHPRNYSHVLHSIIVQRQLLLSARTVSINSFHQQILPKGTLHHREFVLLLH